MKLSRKIKLRSWLVQDNEIRRLAIILTAVVVAANWLPPEVKDLYDTSKILATTFMLLVPIWMGATVLSRIANYTSLTVTFAGMAAACWAGPPLLCNYLVPNWTFQSKGVLKFLVILALTYVITGLVTSSLKNKLKSL